MATRKTPKRNAASTASIQSYEHRDAKALIRPEVAAQSLYKNRKAAAQWHYDPSLAPELQWDAGNPARELGEQRIAEAQAALVALQKRLDQLHGLLTQIHRAATPGKRVRDADAATLTAELETLIHDANSELAAIREQPLREGQQALSALKALSRPFLNWAGKAERLSFEVPTLPLFIHERLSTQAILESINSHRTAHQLDFGREFFGHPQRSLGEQLQKAYEHPNGWQNRMILGDSLVVMNSLLHNENLGRQVQMIYLDPPYGVKFGSNFQPFVRKRDVSHNDDEAFTREPEMVKAYRDTWELGLHSYLTYLRDRLLLSRAMLTDSGSIFVQISDENLHHVREVMDEVFGAENACAVIPFKKTSGASNPSGLTSIGAVCDYIVWYARDATQIRYRQLYLPSESGRAYDQVFTWLEEPNGLRRQMTKDEKDGITPFHGRRFARSDLSAQNDNQMYPYTFEGVTYRPKTRGWRTTEAGLNRLKENNRLVVSGATLRFLQYADDFPVSPLQAFWDDTGTGSFLEDKLYVVQTGTKVIERCILMTTDPGDLVLDPTCGSGTTAHVAETWGRRWITIDTSRVPLALARQRLLTATYAYHELKEPARGPAGGFVYREKKNKKGEHVGGIVPHITLGSIANNEPPKTEVLVDRPEVMSGITRVCGPFVFEATIPTASGFDSNGSGQIKQAPGDAIDRMIEVLRASPLLQMPGGRNVRLDGIRRPAKTLYLSAEATVRAEGDVSGLIDDGDAANGGLALNRGEPVALLFGPEHAAVSELAVLNAWREAQAKQYAHLYVIGFAIEPRARQAVGEYSAMGLPATYVQATPDILMGNLLKNMRSSQLFSVCGQPDIAVTRMQAPEDGSPNLDYFSVTLRGLDVFDPVTMDIDSRSGNDVPAWFLDTDYNGQVFRVSQAFFPRTQAWDNLKRALKADFDESVWAHLAGDTSTPFAAGPHKHIAVKVIDDRGNELMVVKALDDASAADKPENSAAKTGKTRGRA